VSYYDKIESLIEAILKEGGVSRPDRVARQIVVVLAGAFSMGALRGSEPAVAAARETLAAIVATAMPES
jgi:hypothetical protein